jgi:CubicO group peptidase (beta-lactamase class C family)
VAAVAALRLVEQGKLDLDEDVNLKLKTWKVPECELTKEHRVTLRGLLSHSAGMTVHGFPGYAVDAPLPTLVQILNGESPANTAPIRVDIAPGSRFRYSGGGYTVLQQLLMDVTGASFPALARELVLAPIGMPQSGYENPPSSAVAAAAATGHQVGGESVKGRWHIYPEMAAAGLWTTASDLARYAIEVQRALAGESKVLSRSMALQMLSVQKGEYGLGVRLQDAGKDTAAFSHGGVDEGFDAFFTAYCERGQGAAVMMNANRAMPLGQEVLRAIAREYGWPGLLPEERVVASVAPSIIAAYAGNYEFGRAGKATVTVEAGRLFLKPQGQSKEELFPESETTFFPTIKEGVSITFVKDADGKVTGLIFRQGGYEEKAKKAD